jgi:primary-amine oxidase
MISFLEQQYAGNSTQGLRPPREARVHVVIRDGEEKLQFFEFIVDLERRVVVKRRHLKGKHSHLDTAYMQEVEEACMADERVQKEIKRLKLPDGATVCVEPWAYATDGMNDMTQRTSMVCSVKALLSDYMRH